MQVLRGYFSSILALAQGLLRSSDPCVVPFGGHMYRLSFTVFDPYCQQVRVGFIQKKFSKIKMFFNTLMTENHQL